MTINEKFRKLFKEDHGLQKVAAALAGMTEFQMSKVIHGKRRLTAEEFLKLCVVLKLDPNEFLECRELATVRAIIQK